MLPRMPVPSQDLLLTLRRLAFPSTSTAPIFCGNVSVSKPTYHSPFSPHRLPRSPVQTRNFSTNLPCSSPPPPQHQTSNRYAPKTHDRGPPSQEDTQTDFSAMDIFNTSSTPTPATSIDACTSDGFHLNNGVKTSGGKGVILVGGECFVWSPHPSSSTVSGSVAAGGGEAGVSIDTRGTLHLPSSSLSLLTLLYPKPDLLLLGTGSKLWMLSKQTRAHISELGMRVDMMDTGNASATYNLLAQERGVEGAGGVGALMLPLGWKG